MPPSGSYFGGPFKRVNGALVIADPIAGPLRVEGGVVADRSIQTVQRAVDMFSQDVAYSGAESRIEYEDSADLSEDWSDLASWTLRAANTLQVSAGRVYGTAVGSGGDRCGNYGLPAQASRRIRVVTDIDVTQASASGGVMLGVSTGAAGAAPGSAGASAYALYFQAGRAVQKVTLGVVANLDQGALTATAQKYYVTITIDVDRISIVARAADGNSEARAIWANPGTINNLFVFNSCSAGLTAYSVGPMDIKMGIATVTPRVVDGSFISSYRTIQSTGNMRMYYPIGYDSRRSYPMVIVFHGSGSDENHWTDNFNGRTVVNALLAAGYLVLAASETNLYSWGRQESIDNYVAAYRWAIRNANINWVGFYANSMGGIESQVALMQGKIPCFGYVATSATASLENCYANALFANLIVSAYGIDEGNPFDVATAGHDPLRDGGESALAAVPSYWITATDDASVNAAANSQAMVAKLQALGADVAIDLTTGGHSFSFTTWTDEIVAHFSRCRFRA